MKHNNDNNDLLVLGISVVAHDATLAATLGGSVLGVIELERMHKKRYFDVGVEMNQLGNIENCIGQSCNQGPYAAVVARFVLPALTRLCELAVGVAAARRVTHRDLCELHYDIATFADPHHTASPLQNAMKQVVHADKWMSSDHHHAHAALGWLDSPFYHKQPNGTGVSIILSYDGFGNDGTLRTFIGSPGNATLIPLGFARVGSSFGVGYDIAAGVVRDLAWGDPYGAKPPCPYAENPTCKLALPGSFMAFAATGSPQRKWAAGARLLLNRGLWNPNLWPSPAANNTFCELINIGQPGSPWVRGGALYFACDGIYSEEVSKSLDRDFAATVQKAFESTVLRDLRERLVLFTAEFPLAQVTSLIISGGCALNVKANSALARGLGLPTHVPSAPGDNGLALGAAWLASPPKPGMVGHLQFMGEPLRYQGEVFDNLLSVEIAIQWGATELKGIQGLVACLLDGAIVAVVRGRAEFGPRALGHRSLLSSADRAEQKDRLNRLKHRRWYRPCAPIVAAEDLEAVFEPGPDLATGSPYMSFAPPLQPWVAQWLPAVAHLDGTARPQGVRQRDDPWMYSLLQGVRSAMTARYGHDAGNIGVDPGSPRAVGILINTSLNPKGKPIVEDVYDVLLMFCGQEGIELDFVLVEERWLFKRSTVVQLGLCKRQQALYSSISNGSWQSASPDSLPMI